MIKLETLRWAINCNIKGGLHSDVVSTLFSTASICSPNSV